MDHRRAIRAVLRDRNGRGAVRDGDVSEFKARQTRSVFDRFIVCGLSDTVRREASEWTIADMRRGARAVRWPGCSTEADVIVFACRDSSEET
jgi:hypothetical protein